MQVVQVEPVVQALPFETLVKEGYAKIFKLLYFIRKCAILYLTGQFGALT
jgi:hypothetical protein